MEVVGSGSAGMASPPRTRSGLRARRASLVLRAGLVPRDISRPDRRESLIGSVEVGTPWKRRLRPARRSPAIRSASAGPPAARRRRRATVAAVGRLTEALESCERARGHLYSFHQLTGRPTSSSVTPWRSCGRRGTTRWRPGRRELVGRNVIKHRRTFQIVEAYDDSYWSVFRDSSAPSGTSSRLAPSLRGGDERGPPHARPRPRG